MASAVRQPDVVEALAAVVGSDASLQVRSAAAQALGYQGLNRDRRPAVCSLE